MAGLRSHYRGSASGITDKIGADLASALEFLQRVKVFTQSASEFLVAIGKVELLQGQPVVNAAVTASATLQFVPHGLGREYTGALIGAQGPRSTRITVALPANVRAAGRDPALVFGVEPSAAVVVTFSAWVY